MVGSAVRRALAGCRDLLPPTAAQQMCGQRRAPRAARLNVIVVGHRLQHQPQPQLGVEALQRAVLSHDVLVDDRAVVSLALRLGSVDLANHRLEVAQREAVSKHEQLALRDRRQLVQAPAEAFGRKKRRSPDRIGLGRISVVLGPALGHARGKQSRGPASYLALVTQ